MRYVFEKDNLPWSVWTIWWDYNASSFFLLVADSNCLTGWELLWMSIKAACRRLSSQSIWYISCIKITSSLESHDCIYFQVQLHEANASWRFFLNSFCWRERLTFARVEMERIKNNNSTSSYIQARHYNIIRLKSKMHPPSARLRPRQFDLPHTPPLLGTSPALNTAKRGAGGAPHDSLLQRPLI
jgi:hypothetical protein